jgi:trehalose/maltose hydrolase-like predicted phosphorylase
MTEAAVHLEAERRAIDPWILEFEGYDPAEETLREALCTIGNGRMASRGAAPEHAIVEGHHYPGTYVAGLYNRLTDQVAGRDIENESLVNLPNWLYLTFRIGEADWFSIDDTEILHYHQALEMDRGILVREARFRDPDGRETSLTQRRLVSMASPHIAALETNLRAENWEGEATFRSLIDGRVENRNVARYRELKGDHLEIVDAWINAGRPMLRARTTQSRVEIVTGARHRLWVDHARVEPERRAVVEEDTVGEELTVVAVPGAVVRVEKIVCLLTSRDDAISEPGLATAEELEHAPDFADLEEEHARCWMSMWRRFDVQIEAEPRVRQITNLHSFHLLQVASPNIIDIDAGIPARGLHGEAYRGHVFWDELFVFPVLHVRSPEVARSLLRYRYRRLPAARRAALSAGYAGAMFPWQSGSDGREETQQVHLNPRSGRWFVDRSRLQRHINIAIAYNVLQYLRFTHDVEFLSEFGAEMLVEIARFWASAAEYDRIGDSYQITGVMGPDEFHDEDPSWEGPGLRNNAYTNVMVSWLFAAIPEALQPLPEHQRESLFERIGLDQAELSRWDEISRKLVVPLHDGIISQFEGYEQLQELDWDRYRERYGNIERLDRILESEGDSVSRYKASKQADVLMLFYLLTYEELIEVFARLGVVFDEDMLARNIDYYLERTSHGSTLSRLVHSWVMARSDRRRSVELFRQALESDISDIQGGTTAEGIHLGAMAGTVDMLLRGYSGMSAGADGVLRFKPSLDPALGRLDYCIYYDRRWLYVSVAGEDITLTSEVTSRPPVEVECRGQRVTLASGMTTDFN